VFTKLDLANGYWHVPMEEESSYLTTFITEHGRCRWLRLPFRLVLRFPPPKKNKKQKKQQQRLHHLIDGLSGVICVSDIIVVDGCGGDKDNATKDHNVKLPMLERCRNSEIALNKKKMLKENIAFFSAYQRIRWTN